MEDKMAISPYSYHTFCFPFFFETNKKKTRELFETQFLQKTKAGAWEFADDSSTEDKRLLYAQYHYFNASARDLIYSKTASKVPKDEVPVWNYKHIFAWKGPRNENNPVEYVIRKAEEEQGKTVEYEYRLKVNAVRLKLFFTGVGILIFELENCSHPGWSDICRINEFGRRIFLPYYYAVGADKQKVGSSLTADEVFLREENVWSSSGSEGEPLTKEPGEYSSTVPISPIGLLFPGVKMDGSTDDERYIEPIIDDRMFVCSYIKESMTERYVTQAAERVGNVYRYLYDAENLRTDDKNNIAQRLYEQVFIDGNGSSCQNRTMLAEALKSHLYCRWLENYCEGNNSGSMIGVTEYGMVMLAGETCPGYLADSFLTQYIEMMTIVLAQRASLCAFEYKIGRCAVGKENVKKINDAYVRFQSALLQAEVTSQQQGIDLYAMMQENLFIEKESNNIEKRIDNLFNRKSAKEETTENVILFGLACLGVFDAFNILLGWLCSLLFNKQEAPAWLSLPVSACIIVAAIILFIISKRKRK